MATIFWIGLRDTRIIYPGWPPRALQYWTILNPATVYRLFKFFCWFPVHFSIIFKRYATSWMLCNVNFTVSICISEKRPISWIIPFVSLMLKRPVINAVILILIPSEFFGQQIYPNTPVPRINAVTWTSQKIYMELASLTKEKIYPAILSGLIPNDVTLLSELIYQETIQDPAQKRNDRKGLGICS